MPNIAVCGDIHGDITKWYVWLQEWQKRTGTHIDGILHVGDFGVFDNLYLSDFLYYWAGERTIPIPTWVCPGNHESWAMLEAWKRAPERIPNLHLLGNGEITEVLGVKVGAIWGNFSYKSWNNSERIHNARRNHPDSPKAMHIEQAAVRRLQRAGKFDMLITHDAPAGIMKAMRQPEKDIKKTLGMDEEEKAQGCPGFNELYTTGKPFFHYFGHFHCYYVCQREKPKVTCLHAFGYQPDWHMEMTTWV